MKASIYYFNDETFDNHAIDLFIDAKTTQRLLNESGLKGFELVGTHQDPTVTSKEEFAEKLFAIYNNGTEEGNPLGTTEGQQKIRSLGVGHTSMSVNDFVVIDGEVLIVDGCGFLNIGKHKALSEVTA